MIHSPTYMKSFCSKLSAVMGCASSPLLCSPGKCSPQTQQSWIQLNDFSFCVSILQTQRRCRCKVCFQKNQIPNFHTYSRCFQLCKSRILSLSQNLRNKIWISYWRLSLTKTYRSHKSLLKTTYKIYFYLINVYVYSNTMDFVSLSFLKLHLKLHLKYIALFQTNSNLQHCQFSRFGALEQ